MTRTLIVVIEDPDIADSLRGQIALGTPVVVGGDEKGDDVAFLVPGKEWPKGNGWLDLFSTVPPDGGIEAINESSFCSAATGTIWHITDHGWLDSGHRCGPDPHPADERALGAAGESESPPKDPSTLDLEVSSYLISAGHLGETALTYALPDGSVGIAHLRVDGEPLDCERPPTFCVMINRHTGCERRSGTRGRKWYRCFENGRPTNYWEVSSDRCNCP